ncbi:hypothetical protein [Pseudooceanicola sp. MF1-13]|uniref:hypothetical protein n=1 Tax=Pseudooceanicola sp. MF1-13 TaxID=3379095 RepID=UPI003892B21D
MTNWFKTLFAPVQTPAPGDPMAHPDIQRMTMRDLADLPLVPPPAPGAGDKARSNVSIRARVQPSA